MELKISIEKKHLVYLIVTLAILTGINYSIAQTGTVPNPGHSAEQIGEGTIANTLTISGGNMSVSGDLEAESNSWGNCTWEGSTCGTWRDGETLFGYCSEGSYIAGIKRWHGNFNYGIECLDLYCCKL